MIRFVSPALESVFLRCCNTKDLFCAKIYSQYQTYGAQSGLADFWLLFEEETLLGAVSRCANSFMLAAREVPDKAELIAFLQAAGCSTIEAALPLLDGLGQLTECGFLLKGDKSLLAEKDGLQPAEKLSDIWKLLSEVAPEFTEAVRYDAWLAELSHKTRHGLAKCFTLTVNDRIVSTASILFENDCAGVLAMVAADPAFLGHGFGRRAAAAACADVYARGKIPLTQIKNRALLKFYAALGMFPCGEWGRTVL